MISQRRLAWQNAFPAQRWGLLCVAGGFLGMALGPKLYPVLPRLMHHPDWASNVPWGSKIAAAPWVVELPWKFPVVDMVAVGGMLGLLLPAAVVGVLAVQHSKRVIAPKQQRLLGQSGVKLVKASYRRR
jgi:hypothetical protein